MSVGGTGNEEVEEIVGALINPLRSAGETPVENRKKNILDVR